jgi:hypothetical protein
VGTHASSPVEGRQEIGNKTQKGEKEKRRTVGVRAGLWICLTGLCRVTHPSQDASSYELSIISKELHY